MTGQLQVAVLGLGRFGAAVARELTLLGHDVLAVDLDPKAVQDIASDVMHAVQADITDLETLEALGIGNLDAAVVGVSENLEVSVLASVHLQRLGLRHIVAKAANDVHGHVLRLVGATEVVYPEIETAARVARTLSDQSLDG